MSKCKSTLEIVQKLYKEHNEIAAQLGCATVAAVAKDPTIYVECIKVKGKIEEVTEKIAGLWQDMMKNNGWAKLGPRELRINRIHSGTLVGAGDRKFISTIPWPEDDGELVLREEGGKSKVQVTLCLINHKGDAKEIGSWSLNEKKSEVKDDDQVLRKKFTNAKGKFVVVNLDGKSVTKKFEYTIRVKTIKSEENDKRKVIAHIEF